MSIVGMRSLKGGWNLPIGLWHALQDLGPKLREVVKGRRMIVSRVSVRASGPALLRHLACVTLPSAP